VRSPSVSFLIANKDRQNFFFYKRLMQNCGIKVEHKSIIKQIRKELVPASYAE